MITAGDEYPLHQTSRPVRDPGTERNLYDRFFFNGYRHDGSVYFAAAFGMYPGRNIMDGAISVVVDGVQHNVRASRLLGADRLDTRVGPVRVEIIEPLRRLRVVVDDAESGFSADLLFTARCPLFEEPHYLWAPGHRTVFDITRLTQNGTWSGSITVPDGAPIAVDDASWLGTRDRSWGVRPIGEREGGAMEAPPGFYWLWAPLNFDDGGFLFDVNEYPDGRRWHHSAMWAPAGPLSTPVEQGAADYDFHYRSGTRHAEHFELRFTLPSGERKVSLEPLYNFYMQGIGYTHPQWGHGCYVGDDVRAYDTLVTAEQDEMSPFNQHVQTLVTATRDDGAEGIGILEQLIIGPHAPSGLTEILDPHP
jgi:hypothetical protein